MNHRIAGVVTSLTMASVLTLLPVSATARANAEPYDFNGDGYPELVIGAPGLQVGSYTAAGGVVVLSGSRSSLSLKERVITQSSHRIVGASEADDKFGTAFASADFDRDGYADLAVGQPGEKLGDVATGGVTILYGSEKGLRGKRSVRLSGPSGYPEGFQGFGEKLVAADLDGDGWPDLAVGNPGRCCLGPDNGEGRVSVFSGGRTGFSATPSLDLHPLYANDEEGTRFGAALAVADVDRDGRSDLVVGSSGRPYDHQGEGADGQVTACYGASSGPTRCVLLSQSRSLAGLRSLAAGNVFGDARSEIVAGVPQAISGVSPGQVLTLALSGSRSAPTVAESSLNQDSPGVPGIARRGDDFGADVLLGDLDHDGFADLVVGAPGEAVGGSENAGRVTVVYGGSAGYRTNGALTYDQDTTGIPGRAEGGDRFGSSVALFDHNKDGHLDLAAGAPGENEGKGAASTLPGEGTSFATKGARTFTLRTLGYSKGSNARFGAVLGDGAR